MSMQPSNPPARSGPAPVRTAAPAAPTAPVTPTGPTPSAIQPAAQTALTKSEDALAPAARALAERLKFMVANGRKLSDQERYSLAWYGAVNDLNPFVGECYYIPEVGPCPGIAGWRKKAAEQLDFEANQAGIAGATITTEDRDAQEGEAVFDATRGDIAVVVTVYDSLSTGRWQRTLFDALAELKALGVANPWDEARYVAGPKPSWYGVGVVYGTEKFGNGVEKFDRRERARKRAEHQALRHRFTHIKLGEPVENKAVVVDAAGVRDVTPETKASLSGGSAPNETEGVNPFVPPPGVFDVSEWTETPAGAGASTPSGRSEQQNLYDLGFGSKPQ